MVTTTGDPFSRACGLLRAEIDRLNAPLELTRWQFRQEGDSGRRQRRTGWVVREQPISWDTSAGAAWLVCRFPMPSTIAGHPVEGAPVFLRYFFPAGVTVFINGKEKARHQWWADSLEDELLLSPRATPGETCAIAFRTPCHQGIGSFHARLSVEKIDLLLFELRCLLHQFLFASALCRWTGSQALRAALKAACAVCDRQMASDRNSAGLLAMVRGAEHHLEPFRPFARKFTVHLIGHAHIDMNWLWPQEETERVILRDFASVCHLMDEFPDLTFSQSQGYVYSLAETQAPSLLARIKRRVREGRWEVTASAWVEGDLNMCEGETLLRHIVISQEYARRTLGRVSPVMWCPDTFGHPATMPTILSEAGIPYYFCMRCTDGRNLFRWAGKDGREVTVFSSAYNNRIDADTILPRLISFRDRYGTGKMPFVYGVGNHGGGPTRREIQKKMRLDTKPVMPSLIFSTMNAFFSSLTAKERERIPVVRTELNPVFEGCYTTHSDIKRANAVCQSSLLSLEAYAAAAGCAGALRIPPERIAELWKPVLFNQFHDILDGSAIRESYDYSNRLAAETLAGAERIRRDIRAALKGSGNAAVFVFNPLGWSRRAIVSCPLPASCKGNGFHLVDSDGTRLPAEVHDGRISFRTGTLPGFSSRRFRVREGRVEDTEKVSRVADGIWESRFLRLEIDMERGLITRIFDRLNRREVIPPCASIPEDPRSWRAERAANLLQVHREEPHRMSAWVIGNIRSVDNLLTAQEISVSDGIEGTLITVRRKYGDSSLLQTTRIPPDRAGVDFSVRADWREKGSPAAGVPMVRAFFSFLMRHPHAVFEVPFGVVRRLPAGREYPALKWAALRDRGYCAALLTCGTHGYFADGSSLSLTLLRNAYEPDSESDTGHHEISYRLIFGKMDDLSVMRAAMEFATPPETATVGIHGKDISAPFDIRGEVLVTSLAEQAARPGRLLVRVCEVLGKTSPVVVTCQRQPSYAALTDPAGQPRVRLAARRGVVSFTVNPYSVATLCLAFPQRRE